MNEYLKKIYEDAKNYMPHGKNGLIWTSGTWSENYVMSEEEKLDWDKWLNGVFISNHSKMFNENRFEKEVVIHKRRIHQTEHISSIILYQHDEKLYLEPIELNKVIKETCKETRKSQEGVWFYGSQGDTYNYSIYRFGTYTLESLKTDAKFVNYEANLEPLFANLINETRNQTIRNNYQLFSGIVGVNKDWLILLVFKKDEEISISIYGEEQFCKLIDEKLKAYH